MKPIIAPSILSANFANLERDFEMLNQSVAPYVHVDVMDGVFVPNISLGLPIVKAMRKLTTKVMDVHLMIVEPDKYIDAFKEAGADILTVHYEACSHLHRSIQKIKSTGMKAGVAINPHTSVALLEDILMDVNLVCVMSVNPGFGGQQFIENTYKKVRQLRSMADAQGTALQIEIDGGVTLQNAKPLVDAGASVLVAGNTVFSATHPIQMIEQLSLV